MNVDHRSRKEGRSSYSLKKLFMLWINGFTAFSVVPLSLGPILEATGYIYVTIFGIIFFKEKTNGLKIVALGLIIGGIVVYSAVG